MAFYIRLFLSIIFVCFSLSVSAQETSREIVITDNADYFGFDLRSEKEVSLEQCKQICISDSRCRAFTYNTRVEWCFLKSDFSDLITFEGAIAGKVVQVSGEPDLGAPPELVFVPASVLSQASSFRAEIGKINSSILPSDIQSMVSLGRDELYRNDTPNAEKRFRSVLAASQANADGWLAVSNEITNWLTAQKRYDPDFKTLAINSAIGAYSLSRTASIRSQALSALAKALLQNSFFSEAIIAYRQSLDLKDDDTIKAAYLLLRREKGFRITGHTVNADNGQPQICVDFSEKLSTTNVDYENFVAVQASSSAAISASEQQICVAGFNHGDSYRVTLREGLPSAKGEVLLESVTLDGYIRDRAPAVRFTGDSFILASAARKAIPIIGINEVSADLELYRVGERSLAQLLAGSRFLSQINEYRASDIADDYGQSIWKGSIELAQELNREVVTGFPIEDALPVQKPGIYVLTAKGSNVEQNRWEPIATQWFLISDIGLVTYAGNDGLTVFANSLDTGQPMAGVSIELIARNNEILDTATTDKTGRVTFDPGLMRGAAGLSPTVIMAKLSNTTTNDFVFLDLTRAGFDLSDRGVQGRSVPGPHDVFTYLDRGIYRPGEQVNIVSLIRDYQMVSVDDLPVTLSISRPDEVEAERIISSHSLLGGHATSFRLPDNAMRGVWKIALFTNPEGAPISESKFLVEDFVPDRIELNLTSNAKSIYFDKPTTIAVDGQYLYGAPAANLAIDGEVRLKTVRSRESAPGYEFGLADESEIGETSIAFEKLPSTDQNGRASIDVSLKDLPATTRPLVGEITVRMREDGGRAVERSLTLPVQTTRPMIGVRPGFEDNQVAEGSTARFRVIAIDGLGNRIDMSGLNWSLYRIERNYQWYRQGAYWNFEATEIPKLIDNGKIQALAAEAIEISSQVDWGRYRLDVESAQINGPATSISFEAGWYVETSSTETPDALEVALDQSSYKAGDTARLNVVARGEGQLMVVIGTDRILDALRVSVPAGESEVKIPISEDWGAGAYVTATLLRPGSAETNRLPARAIGTTWLAIEPGDKSLSVSLDLPDKIKPNQSLDVPVTVTGLDKGAEVFVTVSAVDVGILNLTRYSPPNPSDWYFGQRSLGLEIRDLYGRLIDSSQGALGRIRSGGDGPGLTAEGSPPTQKLLSLFSGVIRLDGNGQANIRFDIPQFNGTARIMVVAWSRDAVGQTSSDVIIRDPVIVSISPPKVLAPRDTFTSLLEIHNTDGDAGAYQLTVSSNEFLQIAEIPENLILAKGERRVLELAMEATRPGQGELIFKIAKDGKQISQETRSIHIRPATAPVATQLEFQLAANGGSFSIDKGLIFDDYVEDAEIAMTVAYNKSINLSALLTRLDRYPYGCAEQTVSRAMPLLYLSDLNAPESLTQTKDLVARVDAAIKRVSSFQSASGGFGLWGPGSGNMWLDAYIGDFLTRAREKSYTVSEQVMRLAIQNLQNSLAINGENIDSNSDAIAYALYVLARNKMASSTDLRYYADTRIEDFKTPLARAHLGAALALYNEQQRSVRTFSSALRLASAAVPNSYSGDYYGSPLRDGAAILALAAETAFAKNLIPEISDLVNKELGNRRYTSTQEDAWLVLAARAIEQANSSLELSVNDKLSKGLFNEKITGKELVSQPITIVNRTANPASVSVTKYASPLDPLVASANGYEIRRHYYRLNGELAPLNSVRQNERFVVVLTVTEFERNAAQILVTDLLPGGFEVDNPRLVKSAELENFSWLAETEVVHTEFRDDRFVAAFERAAGNPRTFHLAYVVRAVTPGRYTHPAANVEDMYRPEHSARTATGFLEVFPVD